MQIGYISDDFYTLKLFDPKIGSKVSSEIYMKPFKNLDIELISQYTAMAILTDDDGNIIEMVDRTNLGEFIKKYGMLL